MGRASRRKRANGGTGFYRREHLLAAVGKREDATRAGGGVSATVLDEPERRAPGEGEINITLEASHTPD